VTIDRAIEAKKRHERELLKHAGVVGVAVGLGPGDTPAIVVYLRTTEGHTAALLPPALDGVPVITELVDGFRAA
jgi:hypothetical protein